MRRSIAVRLAIMYALAAVLCFGLIGVALHRVLDHLLQRHQLEQLEGRAVDLHYVLIHGEYPLSWQRLVERLDALTPMNGRVRYWIWSEDPAFRYGADLDQAIAAVADRGTGVVLAPLGADAEPMMLTSRDAPANKVRPAVRMIVGVDSQPYDRTLARFESALGLLILAGALVVAALSYWIARIGLAPFRLMARAAAGVGPDARDQRLAVPDLPPELAALGDSFNHALDRLDRAYRQLEVFNADVAHELRTPLGNLIGLTQVALARDRDSGDLREVLASNLEELERMRTIVSDMLFMARADQGERALRTVEASLAEEVGRTVDFLDMLLEDAGQRVQIEGDEQAPVEVGLLRRALTNLLQNAIQHSPRGSLIQVRISRDGARARIAFTNPSATIPPSQLDRLFDRFYRVEAARPASRDNHGLGLSIVKAVAQMHGGAVFAQSAEGLTTIGFSLELISGR